MICKAFLFKLITEQILSLNVCCLGPCKKKKYLKRISVSGSIYTDTIYWRNLQPLHRLENTIITFFNTETILDSLFQEMAFYK